MKRIAYFVLIHFIPVAHAGLALPEAVTDGDFYQAGRYKPAQVRLGKLLFFDKILSGNKNIACATCHHPKHGSSDELALSLGEGAVGLGPQRRTVAQTPVTGRVPRNSPALYMLGARQFERLFHDGRVEKDDTAWHSGYWTPARQHLPQGLHNVLAVQAMFPVTSSLEMAGQKGENPIANAAARRDFSGAWHILARRLQSIPEYVGLFQQAYEHINVKEDIRFVDAANALAAFEAVFFRADNSPFDKFLRSGDERLLGPQAHAGMRLFYGRANCASCHRGKFQTDHQFHAIAMPQIGPGKNDGWDQSYWQDSGYFMRLEDFGRGRVTMKPEDNYKFRTPSLRNVAITGPWGHAGTFNSLEEVVLHHLNPEESLNNYVNIKVKLPRMQHVVVPRANFSKLIYQTIHPQRMADFQRHEFWVQQNVGLRSRIAHANELKSVSLTPEEVKQIVAFLHSLTDPGSLHVQWIPRRVPSGLSVDL